MKRALPIAFAILMLLLLYCIPLPAQTTAHSNVLNWTASTSAGVTGYNVYKLSGACPATVVPSAFTKLTAAPITVLTYTDASGLVDGQINCYFFTAVSPAGESLPSGTLQMTTTKFTAPPAAVPTAPGVSSGTVQ